MSSTMSAVVIREPGGPEVLELRVVSRPVPGPGEARVRVRATAVNRADLLQRAGFYLAPAGSPPDIPGLELAGEIEALGEGCQGLSIGDRVFGLAGGGTYAEAVVVHHRTLTRIPDGLDFVQAAAVPEAFITAYDAMVTQAGLASGDHLLVQAAASGVGLAAVQLGHALGATVIGTTRTEQKLGNVRSCGMDHGVVVASGTFAEQVRALTPGGRGVDVVLELVGGAYVAEDVACVAEQGRIVLVGLLAGARCELDLGTLLRRRITLRGTVLRARPLEEKIATAQAFARHVVPLFARGLLSPVVDRVLPLASAAEAHQLVASNVTVGKVVLSVD